MQRRAVVARFRSAGGGELIQPIEFRLYRTTSPALMASLVAGVRTRDAAAVSAAAHSLKSSSASIGASGLARLCGTVESLALAQRLREAQDLLPELERLHVRVGAAIDALRDNAQGRAVNVSVA